MFGDRDFDDRNLVDVAFAETGDHYFDMSDLVEVERLLKELGNTRLQAFACLFEIGGRIVLGSVAYTFLKESKISATLAYFQSKMYLCDSYPRRSHISDSASTISYDYYLYSHHHKLA